MVSLKKFISVCKAVFYIGVVLGDIKSVKNANVFRLQFSFSFQDWILNDGQILNWNGEWVRRGDRDFDHQLNPFKSEGGSLPKTPPALAYQVTSRFLA